MNTIAHLEVTGVSLDAIISALRAVVASTSGWGTNEAMNADYSGMHGAPCFWLLLPSEVVGTPVGVAFGGEVLGHRRKMCFGDSATDTTTTAPLGKGKMRVANIIPSEISQISTEQYNAAMTAVWRRVKDITKGKNLRINFKSGNWSLEDVIPGPVARKMFKQWLHGYPRTFHPTDLERLDFFIVALFRTKTDVTPDYVGRYLVEDLRWSNEDAALVRHRIITGLQILAANRRYWRGA